MTGINLPNHDLEPEDETIKRWLDDRSLRKLLLVGYVGYEIVRLLFTGLVSVGVLALGYRFVPGMPTGGSEVLAVTVGAVLLVLVADLVVVQSHRSLLSYVSITVVVFVLLGLVTARNMLVEGTSVDKSVVRGFSETLVDDTPFIYLVFQETTQFASRVGQFREDRDYSTE